MGIKCKHKPMGQLMFTRTPKHCVKCGCIIIDELMVGASSDVNKKLKEILE